MAVLVWPMPLNWWPRPHVAFGVMPTTLDVITDYSQDEICDLFVSSKLKLRVNARNGRRAGRSPRSVPDAPVTIEARIAYAFGASTCAARRSLMRSVALS